MDAEHFIDPTFEDDELAEAERLIGLVKGLTLEIIDYITDEHVI